jgi:D-alanyl-D-alanine carboxypeptidase/D-alanyl-D-alanine-endopeptidase (penicillin-binding protein 4)
VKPGDRAGAPCTLTLSPPTAWVTLSNRTQTVESGQKRKLSFRRPIEQNVVYVSGQMPLGDAGYADDITVHNPAGLFVAFFREALARNGIKVGGKLRTISSQDRQGASTEYTDFVELGSVDSPPLSDIAREIQKPSQNLYTDLLLAHVGERTRSASAGPAETSEDAGIRELGRFAGEAGIARQDLHFEEGSGLSRNNLATPNATVTLLQHMSRHKAAAAYLNALPIAGVDGTLRNRMKGTSAENNLRAKTGTLRWANSLSGYVTTAAGERLAFCLMLNRYQSPDPSRSARAELDTIGAMLAGFKGKSSESAGAN